MLPRETIETLKIHGTDTLMELRDVILTELARRRVGMLDVVRDNAIITLEHRPHLGREGDPGEYAQVAQLILHPHEMGRANGVMLNRESTRDHLWVEARWL